MCAILHDKYQRFAPGFRLWLTGSHCLSWFTQMEPTLSQHSHKNHSEPFSFCFSHLLFIVCRQKRTFTALLGRRQHLYLFAGFLWANFKFHKILQLHTWVSLSKSNNLCNVSHTCMIQSFKVIIMWISHFLSFVFSQLWWCGTVKFALWLPAVGLLV